MLIHRASGAEILLGSLGFNRLVNDMLVAGGWVAMGLEEREWCRELAGRGKWGSPGVGIGS